MKRVLARWTSALVVAKVVVLALTIGVFEVGLPDAGPGWLDVGGDVVAQSDRLQKKRDPEQRRTKRDKDRRKYPNLTQKTYDKLARIEEAMEEEDIEKAMKLVNDMFRRPKDYNGHEIAQVHKMAAWIAWETEDMEKTIEHYHAILVDREVIPEAIEQSTLYNLAQLYFQKEDFEKSIELITEWMALVESPTASAYYFMARLYYRMEEWDRAETYIKIAINMEQGAGKKISKSWWEFLLSAYFEQDKLHESVGVLEILVQEYPEAKYWKQLSNFYGEIGETSKQLGAIEAAHAGGYFDSAEEARSLKLFAALLMNDGAYYRAAKYYQEGIDDGFVNPEFPELKMLAQAYMMSLDRQQAIEVFHEAAPNAPDGSVFESLSRLFLSTEKYEQCIEVGKDAIDKGDLKRPYQVRLIMGTCYVELTRLDDATSSFREALRLARRDEEDSAARMALNWLEYIDIERDRLKALADLSG